MFIFREDLEKKNQQKTKKPHSFLCKLCNIGSCNSTEAGEEEGGKSSPHRAGHAQQTNVSFQTVKRGKRKF